jgi:hypothetical protein
LRVTDLSFPAVGVFSAAGGHALARFAHALEVHLDFAAHRATIVVVQVAVVAIFAVLDAAVATPLGDAFVGVAV